MGSQAPKLKICHQRPLQETLMELNKYLQDTAPWMLIKDEANKQAVADCIFTCLEIVKEIGNYAQIFLPETSVNILNILNISSYNVSVKAGHQIGKPVLLFEKIEDEMIEKQMEKLRKKEEVEIADVDSPTNSIEPLTKPEITYDDFVKLDIRVGTITAAEKVKKADRLLNITLDIGTESRTVVSGIAEHFSPEEIVGQQVTYLANLAPRKLKGIESSGMILMAEDASGKLNFVAPSDTIDPGSVIA